MGTTYHIAVVADQLPPDDLAQRIEQQLGKVDNSMSTYKEHSELSQFNRMQVGQQLQISEEFAEVLRISRDVWERSNGAFDPTVGPLVNLWGFGPQATEDSIPSAEAVASALKNSGFQYVILNGLMLSKEQPVQLDLSAVAKGYAVDLVANLLEMLALPDYLVEVGGEIRVSGLNPQGEAWRVAVEQPQLLSSVDRVINLSDSAIATSGDYRNYFERDGVRYSHTIDPKTGMPIVHHLASTTVLASTCAEADAWATAFLVLGARQSLELAERLDLALYVLVREGDEFKALNSSKFMPYLNQTTDHRSAQEG